MRQLVLCAVGTFLGASVAMATAAVAQEAGKAYVNAGFQRLSMSGVTDDSISIPSTDFSSIVIRGGYNVDTNLGIEAEYATGLGSETANVTVGEAQVPVELREGLIKSRVS